MAIIFLVGILAFIIDTIFSKKIKKIDDEVYFINNEDEENESIEDIHKSDANAMRLLDKRKVYSIVRGCCIVIMIGACISIALTLL